MAGALEDQLPTLAFCIAVASYALGLICAAWIKPELQKLFLFRPRWRHGLRASRPGMTAQAAVALSLSLTGVSRIAGVDGRYAIWLFLLSACFSLFAWANDAAAEKEGR